MLRLGIILVVIVSTAMSAFAEEVAWPSDPTIRLNAQIAACERGDPAVCLQAAAALGRRGTRDRMGHTPASLRARATTLLDEQCTADNGGSCFEYGRVLAKRGDSKTSAVKIARGCELGSGDACTYLAARTKNVRRSKELLERACTLDSAHACESIATSIEKTNPARALELHQKACAGSDATGCIKSGQHKQRAGDAAGAFADYDSACELELVARVTAADVAVCDTAGTLASDATKARELFQSACDAGYAAACIHLGERIARGVGGERDWGAGRALVKDGCKRAHDTACKSLASLEKDRPDWTCNTPEECSKHCDEQLWPACRRLVELDGRDDDNFLASDLLAAACTNGDAIGCRMRGDLETSFSVALPHYRSACKLHDAAACAYVRFDRARIGSARDVGAMRAACKTDRAACALYGLAIAHKDLTRAQNIWREACDQHVGVACRYLAETFDEITSDPDAMVELVLGGLQPGYGTCDCDGTSGQLTSKQADEANRRLDEAQRLLRLGCAAGDTRSCEGTLGPDRVEEPPQNAVRVPAWE